MFLAWLATWVAIENATIFDGTGAVHRDHTIVIQDERIESVAPAASARIPGGAHRLKRLARDRSDFIAS